MEKISMKEQIELLEEEVALLRKKYDELGETVDKLIKALKPFAELGPTAMSENDNQCLMVGATIKAVHYKNAYKLLVKLEVLNVKKVNPK